MKILTALLLNKWSAWSAKDNKSFPAIPYNNTTIKDQISNNYYLNKNGVVHITGAKDRFKATADSNGISAITPSQDFLNSLIAKDNNEGYAQINIWVPYKTENITIHFIDENTDSQISQKDFSGGPEDSINNPTTSIINDLLTQGYRVDFDATDEGIAKSDLAKKLTKFDPATQSFKPSYGNSRTSENLTFDNTENPDDQTTMFTFTMLFALITNTSQSKNTYLTTTKMVQSKVILSQIASNLKTMISTLFVHKMLI